MVRRPSVSVRCSWPALRLQTAFAQPPLSLCARALLHQAHLAQLPSPRWPASCLWDAHRQGGNSQPRSLHTETAQGPPKPLSTCPAPLKNHPNQWPPGCLVAMSSSVPGLSALPVPHHAACLASITHLPAARTAQPQAQQSFPASPLGIWLALFLSLLAQPYSLLPGNSAKTQRADTPDCTAAAGRQPASALPAPPGKLSEADSLSRPRAAEAL